MKTPILGKYLHVLLVAVLIVSALSYWNNVNAGTGDLSTKNRQEIMDLIYNYSYMFDSKNLDGFLNLYSQDAVWEDFYAGSSSPTDVLDTPEKLQQVFGNQMQQLAEAGIKSIHFLTNLSVVRTGPGLAEGTAMFVITHQQYDEPQGIAAILHTGEYKYQFVKINGAWKFRRVEAYVDHS